MKPSTDKSKIRVDHLARVRGVERRLQQLLKRAEDETTAAVRELRELEQMHEDASDYTPQAERAERNAENWLAECEAREAHLGAMHARARKTSQAFGRINKFSLPEA